MESREQGLSFDDKEIEFPTKFARFVHRRMKMRKMIFDQKIRQIGLSMFSVCPRENAAD